MALSSITPNLTGIRSNSDSVDTDIATPKVVHSKPPAVGSKDPFGEVSWADMPIKRDGVDPGLPAPATTDESGRVMASARTAFDALDVEQTRIDLYAILDLVLRVTQEQRKTLQLDRYMNHRNQLLIQQAASERIRESASMRMWGSVFSGAFQMAGGAAALGGGGDAASRAIGSLGTMSESGFGTLAAGYDAERAELEAGAHKQEQATQVLNELMQQLLDGVRNILDKLQSIEQSRVDTNRGISRI